jgi:hypothetical protein
MTKILLSADCGEQKDCLRCDVDKVSDNDGNSWGPRCIKCARLIVMGSRQCVDRCPAGYREDWSSFVSYMGRICYSEYAAYNMAPSGVDYNSDSIILV